MYRLCQLRIIELHTLTFVHIKFIFILPVNEFLLLASHWPVCCITLLIGSCSLYPPPPYSDSSAIFDLGSCRHTVTQTQKANIFLKLRTE